MEEDGKMKEDIKMCQKGENLSFPFLIDEREKMIT